MAPVGRIEIVYRGDPRFVRDFVSRLHDEGLEYHAVWPGDAPARAYVVIQAWVGSHPVRDGSPAATRVARAIDRWRAGPAASAADVSVRRPRPG